MPEAKKPTDEICVESILHDAHYMADVAATLLEDCIGSSHTNYAKNPDTYYILKHEIERLPFCAYLTEKMTKDAIDAYCKSVDLGEGDDT